MDGEEISIQEFFFPIFIIVFYINFVYRVLLEGCIVLYDISFIRKGGWIRLYHIIYTLNI